MSELTPEEAATVERFERAPDALVEDLRDEVISALQQALYGVRCHNGHMFSPGQTTDGGIDPRWCDECGEARHIAAADALLPLIAQREAAARAEGAASVIAYPEQVLAAARAEERERVARAIQRATAPEWWSAHNAACFDIGTDAAARIARGDA